MRLTMQFDLCRKGIPKSLKVCCWRRKDQRPRRIKAEVASYFGSEQAENDRKHAPTNLSAGHHSALKDRDPRGRGPALHEHGSRVHVQSDAQRLSLGTPFRNSILDHKSAATSGHQLVRVIVTNLGFA